jgi:two-component system nitrogen regulation response regulator GlnG
MEAYPWPGNVRELQNTLQRAVVLATSDVLLPKDLPLGQVALSSENAAAQAPSHSSRGLGIEEASRILFEALTGEEGERELLPWVEEDFTRRAMEYTKGNQVKASKLLGITRATLRKRLERIASPGTVD